jgi:hypothetical protein
LNASTLARCAKREAIGKSRRESRESSLAFFFRDLETSGEACGFLWNRGRKAPMVGESPHAVLFAVGRSSPARHSQLHGEIARFRFIPTIHSPYYRHHFLFMRIKDTTVVPRPVPPSEVHRRDQGVDHLRPSTSGSTMRRSRRIITWRMAEFADRDLVWRRAKQ